MNKRYNMLLVIFGFFILAACGSSSSNNSNSSNNAEVAGLPAAEGTNKSPNAKSGGVYTAGKVGVLLKDTLQEVPGPPSEFPSSPKSPPMSQLWVTLNKVSLKMEDAGALSGSDGTVKNEEEGWLTVFEGTARYNLLSLQGDSAAFTALAPVPTGKAGYYIKARLEVNTSVAQNCFYNSPDGSADDQLNPCADSNAYQLDVPSGKVDIEFQPHIYLGQDAARYIVFDFLPADSVKVNETGDGRNILRPVIHAYTMPAIMDSNGWLHLTVKNMEGFIEDVSGCDDPNIQDSLIFSHKYGSGTTTIDISDAVISVGSSDAPAACSSLQAGLEVKIKARISSNGAIAAEHIHIR